MGGGGGGGVRGSAHFSLLYVVLDSPKDVLAECSIFWRVVNVHMIGSLGFLARCMPIKSVMWTIRS